MHGPKQQTDSGTRNAKGTKVFVTYHGPERLTRRYRKFFEIAADDNGVRIVDNASVATTLMNVTITEEETQAHINARIFRAGFVLHEGKSAMVESCLGTSDGEGPDGPITRTGVVYELKKKYPSATRVFVDPIKSNVEPQVAEVIKKELTEEDYVLVATSAEADAVLKAMATIREPVPMKTTEHHISYNITGAANAKSDSSSKIYKAVGQPFPENARACLSGMQNWVYPNFVGQSDAFFDQCCQCSQEPG